jgi:hypothetical protein
MSSLNTNENSRRSFLSSAARILGLAGIGFFAAGSLWKRRRLVREGKCEDPQGRTGCAACRLYADCGLPRALSVKRFKRG